MSKLVDLQIFERTVFENHLCTCPSRLFDSKQSSSSLPLSSSSITMTTTTTISKCRHSIICLLYNFIQFVHGLVFTPLVINFNHILALIASSFCAILSSPVTLYYLLSDWLINLQVITAQDYDHPHGYPTPCTIEETKASISLNFLNYIKKNQFYCSLCYCNNRSKKFSIVPLLLAFVTC